MKSVILSLLVLGVCAIVAADRKYPTYPTNYSRLPFRYEQQLLDHVECKFCRHSISVLNQQNIINHVDFFQYLDQNHHNPSVFQNGPGQRELI